MDKETLDTVVDRVQQLKAAQDKQLKAWADHMGTVIVESTMKYIFVLIVWSAIAGLAVGLLLGSLF